MQSQIAFIHLMITASTHRQCFHDTCQKHLQINHLKRNPALLTSVFVNWEPSRSLFSYPDSRSLVGQVVSCSSVKPLCVICILMYVHKAKNQDHTRKPAPQAD